MKIAFLLPHLEMGGIEKGLVNLVPELIKGGCEIVFIVQSKHGALIEALPKEVSLVDLGGHRMLRSSMRLRKELVKHQPDILYTATNATNFISLIASLGTLTKTLRVVSEHTPLAMFLSGKKTGGLRKLLIRLLYPRAATICAPIQDILDEHKGIIGSNCPVCTVLPNPVILRPTKPQKVSERCSRFVSVGRLSPEKGFDRMVRAFADYAQTNKDGSLDIFGDGPEKEKLSQLIKDCGMQDRIFLKGFTDDVAASLKDADMFLCTSRLEGFGNAILEAMAEGVPVLSVACPYGPRLLLQDGLAGALVTGETDLHIAEAIKSYANDASARKRNSKAALEVVKNYSLEVSAKAHLKLFMQLVSERQM